jgi:hypothetical protein
MQRFAKLIIFMLAVSLVAFAALAVAEQPITQTPAPTYVASQVQTINSINAVAQGTEGTYAYLEGRTKAPTTAASIEARSSTADTKIILKMKEMKETKLLSTDQPVYMDTGQSKGISEKDIGACRITMVSISSLKTDGTTRTLMKESPGMQQRFATVILTTGEKIQRRDL